MEADKALDVFLLDRRAARRSPRTLDYYEWQIGRFLKWLTAKGVTQIADVTRTHIRAYLVSLQDDGWKDRSAHAAGCALRAWFYFLVDEEYLERSPMERLKLPKAPRDPLPALAAGEIERLLAAADCERDRALVLALLDTGCRAAEFVALNVGDVDQAGVVLIRQGKGKKARKVKMGQRSLAAVRRYLGEREGQAGPDAFGTERGAPFGTERAARLPDDAPLWISGKTGTRLKYAGLRQILRTLGLRAGVKECHAHSFRRSCALFMKRQDATELEIALYLGHSDTQVTRTYLALDETDMVRVHDRCGAVASLESAQRAVAVPERPKLRLVGR